METVYTKNIIEFVTVALEYCNYLEHADERTIDVFAPVMQKVLALLYLKAAIVEKPVSLGDADVPTSVTEAEYQTIQNKINSVMGSRDDYFDGENASSVSENLADIYQSVKDFLMNYKQGEQAVSNDSLAQCMDDFENYWGIKLLNCIKALHAVVYSDGNGELQGDDIEGGD